MEFGLIRLARDTVCFQRVSQRARAVYRYGLLEAGTELGIGNEPLILAYDHRTMAFALIDPEFANGEMFLKLEDLSPMVRIVLGIEAS